MTGTLVPSQDASAFRLALEGLLTNANRRDEMGAKARAWARDTVSLGAMTTRYEELYRSVVRAERG